MTDRLSELVRQRGLVSDHLAWLDREIARERASTRPAMPDVPPLPFPTAPMPAAPSGSDTKPVEPVGAPPGTNEAPAEGSIGGVSPAAEELLDQYRVSPTTVHQDVRKGCLLYFAGAFVLLGIVVAILYFTIGSR
jgi:hypothetical protein